MSDTKHTAEYKENFEGSFSAADMADAAAQGFRDGVASVGAAEAQPVGEAEVMAGTNGGFTVAVFKAADVPVGIKLYTSPPSAPVGVEGLVGNWQARAETKRAESQNKEWAEWLRENHAGAASAFATCASQLAQALAQQPAAPSGETGGDWVTVPRVPTDAMLDAMHGRIQILCDPAERTADIQNDAEVWGAMLTAAPQQPAAVDEAWQVQLADALECFWNAAIEGSGYDRDNIIGGMVQGFAAVAYRLREHAAQQGGRSDD